MRDQFFHISRCPSCEQNKGVNHLLVLDDNLLRCEEGHSFPIINGVPRLKPYVNDVGQSIEKYDESDFVDMFTWRQYGNLVVMHSDETHIPRRFFGKIMSINSGGDMFYQALASIASQKLSNHSCIIDIGCGTGILSGLIATANSSCFCVGIDYSEPMAERAHEIICRKGGTYKFKMRTSKLRQVSAEIKTWGLQNVLFVCGDAHAIPVRSGVADLVMASNLLHRTKSPKQVIGEIQRIIKPGGHVMFSNSYDWKAAYTPKIEWFEDVTSLMDTDKWLKVVEIDGVPFIATTYNRKSDLVLNHLTLFQYQI